VLKTTRNKSKSQIVEASCGQCQFGMEGHGCELAVRIDGKPYFVDGTSLDSHGCLMPMMAFVLLSEGIRYWRNKNNRFLVSQFKLLPEENRRISFANSSK
jgi:hypothetical protein